MLGIESVYIVVNKIKQSQSKYNPLYKSLLPGSLLKLIANSVGLFLVLLISAEYAGSVLVLSLE